MINNSLPPPRHYFRGVAVLGGGAGLGVLGGDEGARCTTAQNSNGLPHACMHGRSVQLFAKARRREF